jgi:hypothetical protein
VPTPDQLFGRETRNQTLSETERSGRGGVRVGAGRLRVSLAVRVQDGSFNASRPGHRRALLEDELPAEAATELRELQAKFRLASADGNERWLGHLARLFEQKL